MNCPSCGDAKLCLAVHSAQEYMRRGLKEEPPPITQVTRRIRKWHLSKVEREDAIRAVDRFKAARIHSLEPQEALAIFPEAGTALTNR